MFWQKYHNIFYVSKPLSRQRRGRFVVEDLTQADLAYVNSQVARLDYLATLRMTKIFDLLSFRGTIRNTKAMFANDSLRWHFQPDSWKMEDRRSIPTVDQ